MDYKVYRYFDAKAVDMFSAHMFSIVATSNTAFYVARDEDKKSLGLDSDRVVNITNLYKNTGKPLPKTPEGWAELAGSNMSMFITKYAKEYEIYDMSLDEVVESELRYINDSYEKSGWRKLNDILAK
jgi:hypothetical protein